MKTVTIFLLLSFLVMSRLQAQIQTIDDRVTSILNQMTIEEKIAQLHQNGGFTTPDNSRLHVPGFVMADGPHGVRDGMATSFPVGIGMAAMWDTAMAYRIGGAMGKEFRGKGKNQALGPCLDLDRDPRNGRSPETGGEDPYLDAQTTTAVVRGIQSTPTIATIKHFNVNHRENGRTSNNIIASMRMLMETNGLTFRTAVQEGGALCVMNAYNLINGEKCAENPTLLQTILRDDWGFPYYVVSDWGSIWDTKNAITAGCDVEMGSNLYAENLPSLVSGGQVSEAVIDEAVRRVLRTKLMAGMLDFQPDGDPTDVNSKTHQLLCLDAALESIVLLKNQDHILPLSADAISKVALIGPSAAVAQIDGGGSAYVTPYYAISPQQGIEMQIASSKVDYVKGCDINSADTSGFAAARQAASTADVVIFVGGLDPSQESEGMDRAGGLIDLPGTQRKLISSLAQVNSNIIVVLYSGGICGMHGFIDQIKGLVYAFYPGEEAGQALGKILFGTANPSGKLPVTMPLSSALLPPWNDSINNGLGGGYRWADAKKYPVEFAFGHGLSYTTFEYSNLSISPQSVPYGSPVSVSVDVKNTGTMNGKEVVQLYLSHTNSSVGMPVKELKGFQRVALLTGETKTVHFTVTNDELYYFNETSGMYDVEPGTINVSVGTASDSILQTGSYTIESGEKKPDLRITNLRVVPPYPLPGQKVTFAALIKNQGTGASAEGTPVNISFRVDGTEAATSTAYTHAIPAGGMALIEADGGPDSTNLWIGDTAAAHTLEAVVDPNNSVAECVENNNSISSQFSVYPYPLENIAFHKPVTVSSVENATLGGENAVDGDMSTRWSSAFSDPQYIIVDLGSVENLSEIFLYWETAYAKSYQVQVSTDGSGYKTIYTALGGDGGFDKISTNEKARYVKIYCISRATEWGYSLYEIVIHSDKVSGITTEPVNLPYQFSLSQNFPNPFNPSTVISYEIPTKEFVTLKVFDILGKEVATLVHETQNAGGHVVQFRATGNDGRRLSSGVYFYTLHSGGLQQTKKLVLLK